VELTENVQVQLTLNPGREEAPAPSRNVAEEVEEPPFNEGSSLQTVFPLLRRIEPERERALHRFSVTQLINYQRCPRQYYFDRVLHVPSVEQIAVWNNAESPEPPANLTATLKGAVIHRFCETYNAGEDPAERVRLSLDEVIRQRQAELADRLVEIDREQAVNDMLPLAQNYIASNLFSRIEAARQNANGIVGGIPAGRPGLWSELSFRLRRPLGVLSGAIDKLLITRPVGSSELKIEIIDFKTNRLKVKLAAEQAVTQSAPALASYQAKSATRRRAATSSQQIALDFMTPVNDQALQPDKGVLLTDAVAVAARDYQLQMQAYALAAQTLIPPDEGQAHKISVILHFLEPNVEFYLADELLTPEVCKEAIDGAMLQIVSSLEPEHFPVRPATHCRMCNFLGICSAGREWLSGRRT